MNDTYGDYRSFLEENLTRIRGSLLIEPNSAQNRIYQDSFLKGFISREVSDFSPGIISATDSSEFVRELYNGKKIILVRAFAKTRDIIEKDFICDVIDVDRDEIRNFTILLMEHTEHVATIKLLEKTTPEYVLMDGSLAGRLNHKRTKIKAEKYENFMETYFSNLFKLVRICLDRNIPLVFVAKSSESTLFRRYLLDSLPNSAVPDEVMKVERDARSTDHLLIKSFAHQSGHTVPLKVSYDSDREITGRSRLNVITFHALPEPNDLPVKVDIVLPEAQGQKGERAEVSEVREDLMNMVFWGYGGIKTHNIWLADVDREVKFRQKEIEGLYMRTFERVIGVPFYETRGERRARIRV